MKINGKIMLAVALSMAPLYASAQDSGQSSITSSVRENSAPLFDTDEALRATKEIAQKQSKVNELQVDLNIEQLESKIREFRTQEKEKTVQEMYDARIDAELQKLRTELESKYEAEINAIKAEKKQEVSALEQKLKAYEDKHDKGTKGLRESVFVTKVKTGAQAEARVFADGYVTPRTVGEEITEGVILENITLRGIHVRTSEGKTFLPLVSSKTAYQKVYGNGEDMKPEPSDDEIEGFLRSQMATPAQP